MEGEGGHKGGDYDLRGKGKGQIKWSIVMLCFVLIQF